MANEIEIIRVSGTELYCHYPRQSQAQDCFVELDCRRGQLTARYNPEIGNAVPFEVWHGHVKRFGIPALKDHAINSLLDRIAPLAARVVEGYERRWDGSNHVAHFDLDAFDAIRDIEKICDDFDLETEQLVIWDAGDWLAAGGNTPELTVAVDLGITASTTDEQLDEIEADLLTQAAVDGIDILNGLDDYLIHLRRVVRSEKDEH